MYVFSVSKSGIPTEFNGTEKWNGTKAGTAQIRAKAGKKVLKCKVTVKKADQNNNTTTQAPTVQAPATNATVSQAPNTQNTNVPNSQTSSAPEASASVQPTVNTTEIPTQTESATEDPSSNNVLAMLKLSEDRKTIEKFFDVKTSTVD